MTSVDNQQIRRSASRRISNNIVALLAIIFVLASAGSNYYVITKSVESSRPGSATGLAFGQASICVNRPPTISSNCTGSYLYLNPVECYVNGTDSENETLLYTDNSTIFNVNSSSGWLWYNSSYSDAGSYSVLFTVDDQLGCSNSNVTTNATIVISNCISPNWNRFKNHLSTNLSLLICWDNVSDLRIALPDYGQIRFSTSTSDINAYDLDSNINMSHAYIYLNDTALPNLDKWTTLTYYNITVREPKIFTSGNLCPSNICDEPSYNGNVTTPGNVTVLVVHFTDYYILDSAYLDLSDDTDAYTRYNTQNITFIADYYYGNETDISDGICTYFLDGPGNNDLHLNMTYDINASAFTYTTIIRRPGTYLWNVTCNRSQYYSISASNNVTITNRKPVLTNAIPNETWPEDTYLTGRDLDNYFTDPDGDNLTYDSTLVANIIISISLPYHVLTLTPARDFFGYRNVIYTAIDESNETAQSNLVYLTVMEVEEPVETAAAGGGGGGGGALRSSCEEYWVCQDWTDCLPSGYRSRSCIDLTECPAEIDKPSTLENCTYIPTCFDNIKNGRETGVDCGGHCGPCPTCDDNIKNQGETGVDCGGPCPAVCMSCEDGILNQDEEDIDCGGSCAACPTCDDGIMNGDEKGIDCGGSCPDKCLTIPFLETPFSSKGFSFWFIIVIIILPLLLFVARKRLKKGYVWAEYRIKSYMHYLMTPKVQEPEQIVETVLSRLEDLRSKIGTLTPHDTIEQLVTQMREYVSLMLGIEYAFTYEELGGELERHRVPAIIRQQTLRFFKKLDALRFSEETLSQENLNTLLSESKALATGLASQQQTLSSTITKGKAGQALLEINRALKSDDLEHAKDTYKELLDIYHVLAEEEKTALYPKIKKAHASIAEKTRQETLP